MQTHPGIPQAVTDALAEAATAAGYAPSWPDTQPWRWVLAHDKLDLYLERRRINELGDPDTRLATLSCGAALHHAQTTLLAQGWQCSISRMPDASDTEHLAHLSVDGPAPADAQAVRQVRTIPLRHTDRSPVAARPVARDDLSSVVASVEAHGAWLRILRPDQVLDLVAAGEPGELPINAQPDRSGIFAVLAGHSDEPRDWLFAGEGLSAGWLTATERGVTVLPLGAPVANAATRDTLRRLLAYLYHPYLVLRLGTSEAGPPDAGHPARRPADQLIDWR